MEQPTAHDTPDAVPVRVPRLVGRRAELEQVVGALSRGPATVLVEGEAGVGKSRLLQEALGAPAVRARGPLVAVCPPFEEALTLGPVVDAVRQSRTGPAGLELTALAGALRPLFPEWAQALPPAPEPLHDAGAARHRLFRALAELLDRLGTEILVVEDVHWADDATLGFLLFMAARRPRRISLVVTYRPEETAAGSPLLRLSARPAVGAGHVRICLAPLTVEGTAVLVSSMLDDEHVSDAFARFLHRRTEGLPLAVEESVRLLRDRSDLVRARGEWVRRTLEDIQVPPTIRDAVLERFARLDPDVQEVLRAAAVLTEPADDRLVARVGGIPGPRATAALAAAVRGGVLAEDASGQLRFRHVLAARAVYDDIPAGRRRALHLAAGHALEDATPAPLARLAHHFRAGGDTARWCRYAERAGDLALASGDHRTAVAMVHGVLDAGALPAADVVRLCGKFPVFAFSGHRGRTDLVRTLRTLLDDTTLDTAERGLVRQQLGRMLLHVGQYDAGAAELERAVAELADRPLEAATAMSALSRLSGASCPVAVHRRWLERVTELARTVLPAEHRLTFLVERVTALLEMGDPAGWEAAREIPEAPTAARDVLDVTRAVLNIGDAAMRWGHHGEARRRLTAGRDAAEAHGHLRLRDMAATTLVHLDWHAGAWDGLAERAAALAAIDEEPLIQLDTCLVTGLLAAARGAHDTAADSLARVADEARRRGILDMSLESAAGLARVRLAQDRLDEALALTEEGMRLVVRKGVWLAATEIAPARTEALVAAGRGAEAARLTAAFARGAHGSVAPATRASLATCRAVVAQVRQPPSRAAAAWADAARAWEALPRPYAVLLARAAQARCLAAAGRRDAATALTETARAGLRELGATYAVSRLAALTGHEASPSGPGGPVRGPRGYGDQLSPRELEAVRHMLNGLTNPEIARALYRSPKTIAAQLKSAMRKHGVTSRTALAVSALRAGITPAEPAGDARTGA
ncbi:ATP-binding protein [Streptomyces sp. NPDC059631]|uniref:ATP-binding protein n=1 Tax=unclassified Streptomyces TaxID=2593676 RepID=UPI003689659D